jgi:DNA-binding MarR family transcriptional regulator
MSKNIALNLFLNIAKINTVMSRRFDGKLGGLGFNEFIILFHLNGEKDGKMRRVDLAEKVGLTASGITRQLLPMEKVHTIKREANKDDARVSYVVITAAGKQKLIEAVERAEIFMEDLFSSEEFKKIDSLSKGINDLSKKIN